MFMIQLVAGLDRTQVLFIMFLYLNNGFAAFWGPDCSVGFQMLDTVAAAGV